jgi:hypothetical protein
VGRLLERAPADASEDPVVWRSRAWYERTVGRLDDAWGSIQEARGIDPLSWRSLHEQGLIARARGELHEAERLQRLAEQGFVLFEEFRAQPSIFEADLPRLRRLADYALKCEDWLVAEALHRRLPPEN